MSHHIDHIQKAIRARKDFPKFSKIVREVLESKMLSKYDTTSRLIRRSIFTEAGVATPFSPPANIGLAAEPTLQSTDAEIMLSPDYEKEYFLDSMEYKGKYIVFKKIGLGMAKPIRVYIDNKPWEIFTTIAFARQQVKRYLKTGRDRVELQQAEKEKEEKMSTFLTTQKVVAKAAQDAAPKPQPTQSKQKEPKEDKKNDEQK